MARLHKVSAKPLYIDICTEWFYVRIISFSVVCISVEDFDVHGRQDWGPPSPHITTIVDSVVFWGYVRAICSLSMTINPVLLCLLSQRLSASCSRDELAVAVGDACPASDLFPDLRHHDDAQDQEPSHPLPLAEAHILGPPTTTITTKLRSLYGV
jgi:hypothetical protein